MVCKLPQVLEPPYCYGRPSPTAIVIVVFEMRLRWTEGIEHHNQGEANRYARFAIVGKNPPNDEIFP
jgi:hypothetical protein